MSPEGPFKFVDSTYHFTITDTSYGLQKREINLRSPDGSAVVSEPVVWNRLPFLSSVPSKATLGVQPARVFLRCPDQSVELSRVLSAPDGIKAVVSSPRELTVMLSENAPSVINGIVEVATTAKERPPLRVPVLRYAPVAQRSPP